MCRSWEIKADADRVILIYMCCLVVCIPFLWFIPETKGKSLEEVGLIFGDRHVHVALGSETSEVTQVSEKQVHSGHVEGDVKN